MENERPDYRLARETVAENGRAVLPRLWHALAGDPLVINTEPPNYPFWADRYDRLDHAYINVFTEAWRRVLRRPAGDELSQRFGQVTGIVLLPVTFLPMLLIAGVLRG